MKLLPHMYPHIRISPFIPREWEKILNQKSPTSGPADQPSAWLDRASHLEYFDNGRTALLACLKHLKFKNHDEVLIETTTGGPYISSCVTKTIEIVGRWSRKLTPKTKLVLVIHEFGFPFHRDKIRRYQRVGLPILEDCAYAMGSRIDGADIGHYGDFALYSLPKYYPLPFGGILASREKMTRAVRGLAAEAKTRHLLQKSIHGFQKHCQGWNQTRRDNWQFFAGGLKKHGFMPYFKLGKKIAPGVFVTRVPRKFAGEIVKKRLNAAGVESTQYYHQGGFYFPVHQFLTDYEKKYILDHFLA